MSSLWAHFVVHGLKARGDLRFEGFILAAREHLFEAPFRGWILVRLFTKSSFRFDDPLLVERED